MSPIDINDPQPDTNMPGSLVLRKPCAPCEPDFESVERFQALEPGYYWTAAKDWTRLVDESDTLLLIDVIEFESKVHSVTLRKHPRDGDGKFDMLIQDFLNVFVPNPDGEVIRQREQQAVMSAVSDMQNELMRTQVDPQLMNEAVRERVEAGLREMEAAQVKESDKDERDARTRTENIGKVHRRAARRSAANGNPLVAPKIALASDVGGLIGAGINEQGIAELRNMASRQAVVARAQSEWLQERTNGIVKTMEQLSPYLAERSAVALARMSGAVKMAERIRRGVESLDLYVGKGVDTFDIKTGAEASSTEPLTIIQGKRYAEEELAVWADVDSSFDFHDKKTFFDALASNDALLEQVLPFQRCVVSVAMTRSTRDYGDPMTSLMYNLENQLVFLLVRNGQNVHVVYSGSPSHEGASRLFPTTGELDEPFRGRDGERVSIRDVEFGEKAKQFDDMALVYTRFLILLCGLDHRLNLFGRFYPSELQMRFMSAEFQANYFRFVTDEERGLLIGDGLQDLSDWFASKNRMLQSGSRVFVLSGRGVNAASPEIKRRSGLRTGPEQFKLPFVAFRDSGELVIGVTARDKYGDRGDVTVKCRLVSEDTNVAHSDAWWICVDGVSVAEIRRYRHSRTSRAMGVDYLRLFRRLEDYLEREAVEESAARAYLLKSSVEFGGLTAEESGAALDAAVRNWRAARRGAALPGIEDKSELNGVLSLMVPEGRLTPQMESMLDAYLASSGVKPLLLTRSGKAKLMLYVEACTENRKSYPDVLTWGWVNRITLEAGKTKLKVGSSTLVWLTKVLPASEVEVRRWDGLDSWMNSDSEPMTLRKLAAVLPLLEAAKEWDPVLRSGPGAGIPDELFERLYDGVYEVNARNRSKFTVDAVIAIPVAAYSVDGRQLSLAYMQAYATSVLETYGSVEQRGRVAAHFARSRSQKSKLAALPVWGLVVSRSDQFTAHDKPVAHVHDSVWHPTWSRHSISVNDKLSVSGRKVRRLRGEPMGSPLSISSKSTLSLDRALGQLSGVAPLHLVRAFNKERERRASEVGRWGFSRNADEDESTRKKRQKAERLSIRSETYVHKYKAVLSPLVWRPQMNRSVANALFVAPLLKKRTPAA